MAMHEDEELWTVEQVATYLGVAEWTVRDWLRRGRLIGFQPGGQKAGWRVRVRDLREFVEHRTGERRGQEP